MAPIDRYRTYFEAAARTYARDPTHRLVLRGAAASVAVRVAGVGLSYIANILFSRMLGVHGYGEYVIALSWALVLTLPAKGGFDNSALRYSTIYLERNDPAKLRGFIRFAAATVTLVAAIIALLVLVAGSDLIPVSSRTRLWTAALIPPLALLTVYSVLLRTTRRIVVSQLYEQVLRPALVIASLIAAALAGFRMSASSAMALTTLAAAAALAPLIAHLNRALRSAKPARPRYDDWLQWMAVSVPMLMLGVVQELLNQVDIIMLGQMADARQAAFVAASWRLASLVPFALIGLAMMSGPLIASAHERGDKAELHRVSSVVARAGFGFAIASALALIVLGRPLLGLFGPEFVAAQPVLLVLLAGGVANAFTGVVAYYMTLTGHERQALVIFIAALVLSVGLNILLIPRFGAVGSAIASSSALAAWNLAMWAYVRRTVGIDASALALEPIARTLTD